MQMTRSTRQQLAAGSEAAPSGAASAFLRTIVYVDGFNLYNRLLKNSPHKWLDLKSLASTLLNPSNKITAVNYYTSGVSGKIDPSVPIRQNCYIRALEGHIPGLRIHRGKFYTKSAMRPRSRRLPSGKWDYVEIMHTAEKGSDVNLAAHLLRDAFTNAFDTALVISQDTDLTEPVRIAVQDGKKAVGVASPERVAEGLKEVASFSRHIHRGILKQCQMPKSVTGKNGQQIHKPPVWDNPYGY
ncbi:MAG: NYN domain-containing protein [Acidobacteria bacterium]|nr:NYN domain-containing protein [Acidobacteriota bacterium]